MPPLRRDRSTISRRAARMVWRCGLLAAAQPHALAQPQAAQPPREAAPTVEVVGLRAGAQRAEQRRREGADIVDAVVAAEIRALPDLSVADALQRISGVQVTRDRGEASAFAVRGLTQVETTLDGREIFTAGGGRGIDLADLAADLLAGIDVYKTADASRLEGGIGGSVDLRSWRPLALGDATLAFVRATAADFARRAGAQGSLRWSRRWPMAGEGRLGLLLEASLQDRPWREDQLGIGNPVVRNDLVPGLAVLARDGVSATVSTGRRRRAGLGFVAQGSPAPGIEWLAEARWSELRTRQDSRQLNLGAGTGFEPGSVQLQPGSTDLQRIVWTDAPVSLLGFARDTVDRNRLLALGGHVDQGDWRFGADLSHAGSISDLLFSGPVAAGRASRFTLDLAGPVGASLAELAAPPSLATTGLAYRTRRFEGALDALRLDAEWQGAGAIERLRVGWRGARRHADNGAGLVFGDVPVVAGAVAPGFGVAAGPGGFLGGLGPHVGVPLQLLLDAARDPAALRRVYGVDAPLPQGGNPLGRWRIEERSSAFWLQLDGRLLPGLDAQAGLRVVRTAEEVDGSQALAGADALPISARSAYTDVLPSVALRWRDDGGWQLRAAASRTLARPNFDQLSPSLTLTPNTVNPALNAGSAGNPALRPVRSTNLDLALESAAGGRASGSLTLFWKQVQGFIANASRPETWDGVVYLVNRPYNSDPGRIRGAELAGLLLAPPGPWQGFGLQANYTYVDSRTVDRRLGAEVPLQNLSRHSANLTLMHERGPWSARLAWNGRSRFLSGVTGAVGLGTLPVVTRGYGWVDASLAWRLDDRRTLTLQAGNLTRTLRSAWIGLPTRPQAAWLNDRQWVLGMSMAL